MNVEEFRTQARLALEQALNQLQAITLLITELETQVSEVGGTLKNFAVVIEQLTDQPEDVSQQTPSRSSSEAEQLKTENLELD